MPDIDLHSDARATAYWWRQRPNFGDLLTGPLMKHFANVTVGWAPVADAEMVCVGSLLDILPPTWAGIVAGAGKLHEDRGLDLPYADIRALRGPLTARGLPRIPNLILGDPGLLANELVAGVEKRHLLGIVPHWSDTELEHRPEFRKYQPLIIRASGDPLAVIAQIGSCRKIVASSLHGIILADAFGIPRRTEMAAQFSSPSEGGVFKFRDFNASVGVPFEVGITQEAPRYMVQDRQQCLYDMFLDLGRYFGARR